MFQPGFTLGPRLVNFLYKGAIFAGIGMAAGLAGTAISNGLLALRCKLDPNHVSQNEPPNVVANAGCWALHMGLSSNLRYQILNGFDMVCSHMREQRSRLLDLLCCLFFADPWLPTTTLLLDYIAGCSACHSIRCFSYPHIRDPGRKQHPGRNVLCVPGKALWCPEGS